MRALDQQWTLHSGLHAYAALNVQSWSRKQGHSILLNSLCQCITWALKMLCLGSEQCMNERCSLKKGRCGVSLRALLFQEADMTASSCFCSRDFRLLTVCWKICRQWPESAIGPHLGRHAIC